MPFELPFYRKHDLAGYAMIDEAFADLLKPFRWVASGGPKDRVPPRTMLYWWKHGDQCFPAPKIMGRFNTNPLDACVTCESDWFVLNRVVFCLFSRDTEIERLRLIEEPYLLHVLYKNTPRLSFYRDEPLDCRIANIREPSGRNLRVSEIRLPLMHATTGELEMSIQGRISPGTMTASGLITHDLIVRQKKGEKEPLPRALTVLLAEYNLKLEELKPDGSPITPMEYSEVIDPKDELPITPLPPEPPRIIEPEDPAKPREFITPAEFVRRQQELAKLKETQGS